MDDFERIAYIENRFKEGKDVWYEDVDWLIYMVKEYLDYKEEVRNLGIERDLMS